MKAVFFNYFVSKWVQYDQPLQILQANTIEQVIPILTQTEALTKKGYHAVGYCSYESAPAFDQKLSVCKKDDRFPLCCFAIYDDYKEFEFPKHIESIPNTDWVPSVTQKQYKQAIKSIKNSLFNGDTYQVNFTYRLSAFFPHDPFGYFLSLIENQKTSLGIYLEFEEFAICSASPELFFELNEQTITSRPMKGTVSRGRYQKEDKRLARWLQQSIKNRAENTMITDMIRNDIGKIAKTGSIQTHHLHTVETYKTALQMTSTVTAKTEVSIVEIFQAMFPSASITGAPKVKTMEIIKDLEATPRNIYTGSIGYILPRQARFNVAIRSILIDKQNKKSEFGLGGGIVWDSTSSEELSESLTKASLLSVGNAPIHLLETILWEKKDGFFLLDQHLKRLQQSALYFMIKLDLTKIRKVLSQLHLDLHTSKSNAQILRLVYTQNGTLTTEIKPYLPINQPIKLCLSRLTIDSQSWRFFHKTTDREFYNQAKQEKSFEPSDEVIILNEKGQICESSIYNVVLELNHRLYTPSLECGLLNGTFRQWLLDHNKIQEKILYPEDLRQCQKIYLINSVRKWQQAEMMWDDT